MQKNEDYELLLSSVSHEIRNPVTLINSYLQLLASAHPEITRFEYWDQISKEMSYLRSLLTDISQFNNSIRIRSCPADLSAWLWEYESDARLLTERICSSQLYPQNNITLHTYVSHHLPCSFDPVRLRQVLDNLIRNAAEAILARDHRVQKEPGLPGRILLTALRENQAIQICVSDNGCGLPDGAASSIFRPFESQKECGTGLGLSIARRIIEAHGGTLRAHPSHFNGYRTDFIITLPLKSDT